MAIGPIDYGSLLTQVNLTPLMQGMQLGRQNRAADAAAARQDAVMQLAQRKFEVDQQADAEYLAAVEAYKADPTPAALRDLGIRFPEKAKALMDAGNSYTTSQKQDLIGAGFGALGALAANKPDLAISTLRKRVDALRNSGIDTSHTQDAINMLEAGDLTGAKAYISYAMGGLVGHGEAAGILETLGVGGKAEDRRADNARADRQADIAERRVANSERATEASIARGEAASARAERAADRADRKAAGSGRSGGGGGDGYEYRIGPDGKLQRRRR